ncbi:MULTISPECIES: helix-turn-helix transcriptional regulator [unclassified Acinetobacter]|uniref:helix-turn-helix domain-containing protein n=1 Tax=unclassified Acinetobacter TaxID=196816 RepID=UPI0015D164C0|nr:MULTISPECIES: helix-turn-helix transcriptional regulator [unclassified Acinetobacter]
MYFDFEAAVEYQTSLSAISGYMLLNIRKNLGLGQADMGKLFNMSHATYRSIERGETAINADFIYMLCGIIERKFSDYFLLVEDIAEFLVNVKNDALNNSCIVSLIPNGDFQKLLISAAADSVAVINKGTPNILYDQDLNLFLSPELRLRVHNLVDKTIMKNDFKNIVDATSNDIEEVVEAIRNVELDENGLASKIPESAKGISLSASALFFSVLNPLTAPAWTGLSLYAAYKRSKELKKSKK